MLARRLVAIGVALSLVALVSVHVSTLLAHIHRAPDWDEAEYLHGAWLLSRGKRLYVDFFEHHASHLYAILLALQPSGTSEPYPLLDVPTWIVRARLVVGAAGTVGVLSAGAFAQRVTGRASAAVITVASILAGEWTWARGVVDARNDPPTLALFWIGALSIVWRRDGARGAMVRCGVGVGLLVVVCTWNPKWPFECAALGCFALWQVVRAARERPLALAEALAPTAVLSGLSIAVILRFTTLRAHVFYVFELSRSISRFVETAPRVIAWFADRPPLGYCSAIFRPSWVVAAWAVVLVGFVAPRTRAASCGRDRAGVLVALALVPLAGAATLALTGPARWPQSFLLWSYAGAVIYGCAPSALGALVRGYEGPLGRSVTARVAPLFELFLCLAAASAGVSSLLSRPVEDPGFFWAKQSAFQHELRPDDRVWMRADHHPIAAYDASFYWFAFGDVALGAIDYANAHPGNLFLPAQRDEDLPICRALDGRSSSLRLLGGKEEVRYLPKTRACLEELLRAHRLTATGLPGTLEMVR